MNRCAAFIVMMAALGPSLSVAAQPARFQYDALELSLSATQSPGGPEAFEQYYARAMDEFARTASLAQQRADAAKKREAAMQALGGGAGGGAGDMILDMISGQISQMLSQANPVAGMVFDMAMGMVRKGQADGAMRAQAEARDAEKQLAQQESLRPRLRRISIWDRWLRVDDLDDGSAVIHKPDVNEYLVLDTRQKTWVRLDGAPQRSELAQMVASDPQRCNYVSAKTVTEVPARRIDGHPARGYREIERTPGFGGQGPTMVLESVSYFSDQRIPDDILGLLNGIPPCPADSPAARSIGVPDAYVTFYQLMTTRWEGAPAQAASHGDADQPFLVFEQHLHALTERDRDALFSAPPDYRQLR